MSYGNHGKLLPKFAKLLDSRNFHKNIPTPPVNIGGRKLVRTVKPLEGTSHRLIVYKKDSTKTVAPTSKPFQSPIRYEAKDSIVLEIKSGKANLFKDAVVNTDNMELKARYIEVGLSNKLLFAKGGRDSAGKYTDLPIFKDGADQYVSDSLSYNAATKKGKVYGLSLSQDEAHIQLKQVVKQPDGSFMGQNGKLSTCADPHPHFYLNTSKIKVIPNQKVLLEPPIWFLPTSLPRLLCRLESHHCKKAEEMA